MNGRILLIFSVAACFGFPIGAQQAISVDQAALAQHVDHHVPPVYPPIAKAAHIQGAIVFDITVGVTGKIEAMKVASGPAMLQQAAIDCLKQWTYHPFEKDGAPIAAKGQASIVFMLSDYYPGPDDEKIADRYFPLLDQCRKAVSARADTANEEAVCVQAAETAEMFGPEVRFIEKRSAFVYAATACANNRDLTSALAWAGKAVEVVKLGHDDNSGDNAVYSTKGTIEGMMGDLVDSDRDLSVAEDYGRKAIAWADEAKFEHSNYYRQTMARDLRFHAQVLQALNRPDDAQKKLEEAAKYN